MTSGRRSPRGFTLVEVIVALGIAASALILLLSANGEALRQSIRAREALNLELLAESKLDEMCCDGGDSGLGEFKDLPGWRWEIRSTSANIEDLKDVKRLTLVVSDPSGRVARTDSVLRFAVKGRTP